MKRTIPLFFLLFVVSSISTPLIAMDGEGRATGGGASATSAESSEAKQCPICLADIEGPGITLQCKHTFHAACIGTWAGSGEKPCPMCRSALGYLQDDKNPVMLAAASCSGVDMSTLLATASYGAIVCTGENERPAHFAAQNGNSESLRALMTAGSPCDTPDVAGFTPLYLAVHYYTLQHNELTEAQRINYRECITLLIANGAHVDVCDASGDYMICMAARREVPGVISMLCATEGAIDVNCEGQEGDENGNYPLHYAASFGLEGDIQALISRGAFLDARNKDDDTALHLAVEGGFLAVVQRLCEAGANIDVENCEGKKPEQCTAVAAIIAYLQQVREEREAAAAGESLAVDDEVGADASLSKKRKTE